jgi:isopentenyl-diphosphate delta-isomerase type 1
LADSRNEHAVVSFDDEPLILVDAEDREVGFMQKAEAHVGAGSLHRAFSLFVFDAQSRLLLQQRAAGKRLWGGYWSNTCCSHPRRGETMDTAIHRRLREELGMDCELGYLFKFQYQAQFDADGAEHELCWVYAGRSDAQRAGSHPKHWTPRSQLARTISRPGSRSNGRGSAANMGQSFQPCRRPLSRKLIV